MPASDSQMFDDRTSAPLPFIITYEWTFTSTNCSVMSASTPRLTELPIEILEQIALQLPGQDIIKIEAVRRAMVTSTKLWIDLSTTPSRLVDNSRT